MQVQVQRSQIRKRGDFLYLDVKFPAYPSWPTFGMKVAWPTTKQAVKDAIAVKAAEVLAIHEADEAIRDNLGNEVLNFEVDV